MYHDDMLAYILDTPILLTLYCDLREIYTDNVIETMQRRLGLDVPKEDVIMQLFYDAVNEDPVCLDIALRIFERHRHST
jgi:hypothetical protein